MKIKNRNNFTKWKFYFKDLEGNEVSFPFSGGYATTIHSLVAEVESQFQVFDEKTNGEYTKHIRKDAQHLEKSYQEYLEILIEHQICLRHDKNNDLCWDDGLGDRLHHVSKRIDHMIDAFPSPLKKAARAGVKALTALATGKAKERMGSCQTCGGTKTLDPSKNNLGRAGSLNNLVPSKLPKKARK